MDALRSGMSPAEIYKMKKNRVNQTPQLQIYDVQSMKQKVDLEYEFV